MTDEETSARAHRAFSELHEIAWAFDAVKASILTTLAETPIGQESKVLNLHKSLQNLAAVRQALQHLIDGGKMADAAMEARNALAAAGLNRPY